MTADINGLSCKAVITPACQCSEVREVEEKAAVVKKQLYNNKNKHRPNLNMAKNLSCDASEIH